MQKIELTNKQYVLLLKLVYLGIDVMDAAALGEDDAEEEEAQLMEDALELEALVMSHFKKFGVKNIVHENKEEDALKYSPEFEQECGSIANAAAISKSADFVSFYMGLKDFKEAHGEEALSKALAENDLQGIAGYSTKYLDEIFENGFANFYLRKSAPSKIISLTE